MENAVSFHGRLTLMKGGWPVKHRSKCPKPAAGGAQWADFATNNRGSSYKLHIFIEWSRPGAALPTSEASPHAAKAAAASGAMELTEKISGISIRTHQSSGEEIPRAGACAKLWNGDVPGFSLGTLDSRRTSPWGEEQRHLHPSV